MADAAAKVGDGQSSWQRFVGGVVDMVRPVAAGLAPMGLGSDTGGSVRAPAGLSGTVGLKTTVGRISRFGVFPLSWTLDSVGPLTRSVEATGALSPVAVR